MALLAGGSPAERAATLQARQAADKPATPAYSAALNKQLAAYAVVVGPHAAPAMAEVAGVTLRSVGFDLPSSDRGFPPGPGAELAANNCQSCHSPGMILNQPALTRTEWTGEVNKMLHTYNLLEARCPDERCKLNVSALLPQPQAGQCTCSA